jgi:broad specificity phosphatase PhoE
MKQSNDMNMDWEKSAREALSGDQSHSIYVMRHGKTVLDPVHRSDGWLDFPLSAEGQLSVLPALDKLKCAPIKEIYAPDLKRTRETADLMQSGILCHPPICIDEDLKTWNLGALAGGQKAYNKPVVQHFIKNTTAAPEGGESRDAFRARLRPAMAAIKERALRGDGPFLLISSGSVCRELSDEIFGDMDILDLDEGGLMCLHPAGDDTWTGRMILGHKDLKDERLS